MHTRKEKKTLRRLLAEDSLSHDLNRSEQVLQAEVLYGMSGRCTAGAFSEHVLNHANRAEELLSCAESCLVAARATGTHVQGADFI